MRPVLWTILLLATVNGLRAEETGLELLLEIRPGRGDKPMVVVWVEDGQGTFVETLEICSQDVKYFPEFRQWRTAQNGNIPREIDGLIGATIRWGGKRLIEIPAKIGQNLLDGHHVLCVESIADSGVHYGVLKIPLAKVFKSTTVEHEGYVARATVRLAGSAEDATPKGEPATGNPPAVRDEKTAQRP